MDAKFTCANPDDMEFEMTISMRLKEWKSLKSQMEGEWPASDLRVKISSMIHQAGKSFIPEDK